MQATAHTIRTPLRPATILTTMAAVAILVIATVALTQNGAADPTPMSFGPTDAGSVVALESGHELAIVLPANPTTGYSWVVTALDSAILTQIGEPEFAPESDLTGAAGTVTLRFEAAGVGGTELQLEYLRPWEDVEPLDTFRVTVNVR